MEKEFVPYELAVKLKEIGFINESVLAHYRCDGYLNWGKDSSSIGNDISDEDYRNNVFSEFSCRAPLWQQAFDWLWNKTDKYIIPIPNDDKKWLCLGIKFDTYEEARKACLEKLIQIIEDENKKRK